MKKRMRKKTIDLSLKHNIVTQYTSFVGVEERVKVGGRGGRKEEGGGGERVEKKMGKDGMGGESFMW